VREIDELGREEELDGASDVLEQFCSELFGKTILMRRGDIGHGGGGSRLCFWLGSLQSRTSKKGMRGGGAEGGQRRGARVFERIRGGSEDKEEREQVVVGMAMGKKVEHAPLVLSPRKRTKKEGCFG
jgi:hypothetical protein